MIIAGTGVFLSGVFDSDDLVDGEVVDATVHGDLHDLSGIVAFICLLVLFVVVLATPTDAVGITQRVIITTMLIWLGTLAWWQT